MLEPVRKSSAAESRRILQWCSVQEQEQEQEPGLSFVPWQTLAEVDGDRLVEPRRL